MPSHQHQGSAEPQPGGSGHQQGGASAQHPVAGPSTSGGAWLHQHQGRHAVRRRGSSIHHIFVMLRVDYPLTTHPLNFIFVHIQR